MHFKTRLLQAGKTATGIVIPAEIVEKLGAGRKPPVRVTINGYTYRNTIAVMGGAYMVGVSAEHRRGAGVQAGDEIKVTIELDTGARTVEIPAALQDAFDKDPAAKEYFGTLSNSRKKALTLPIETAKTDDTRNKRVEKALSALREKKA